MNIYRIRSTRALVRLRHRERQRWIALRGHVCDLEEAQSIRPQRDYSPEIRRAGRAMDAADIHVGLIDLALASRLHAKTSWRTTNA